MLDKRSLFCCSDSFGFAGSREIGLYLAKTSMPKSAVALAIVNYDCGCNCVCVCVWARSGYLFST
jgi:hypothetical protein